MTFDNCSDAYNAGYANMKNGQPGYSAKLDRDHDGVACENPPPGFQPATQTGIHTGTQVPRGDQLAKTGPATALTAGGSSLLLLGAAIMVLIRRRRTKFAA